MIAAFHLKNKKYSESETSVTPILRSVKQSSQAGQLSGIPQYKRLFLVSLILQIFSKSVHAYFHNVTNSSLSLSLSLSLSTSYERIALCAGSQFPTRAPESQENSATH